jgi:hypothetical protein
MQFAWGPDRGCVLCASPPSPPDPHQLPRRDPSPSCSLPVSNLPFGLPVVMDTHQDGIKEGSRVLLTFKGQNIGLLEVESKWSPNKVRGGSRGGGRGVPGAWSLERAQGGRGIRGG